MKYVVVGFFTIVVLALGFLLINNGSNDDSLSTNDDTGKSSEVAMNNASDRYMDYSKEALAKSEGQAVLFFHAPWCPQCVQLEKDIAENGVPKGYTIFKVDYDTNQELRKKYNITLQTSLIKVDKNGNAVSEPYIAYNEPTIDAVAREFLN